jgi:regulatory protein
MEQKITKIQAQKRNPNRVNIYLDGEFAFSLARIVAGWLQTGQVLDEQKIATLKNQDGEEKAFLRALSLVGYRPRSEQEVRKKLETLGYSPETIEQVLARLRRAEILNDEKFAREWIENRSVFRPRSRRMMAMELRYKGIPEETVEQAILESDEDENLAYAAAHKRFHRLENLSWEEFRKKLSDYLGRRGFPYETVSTVVRRVWSEVEAAEKENLNERG